MARTSFKIIGTRSCALDTGLTRSKYGQTPARHGLTAAGKSLKSLQMRADNSARGGVPPSAGTAAPGGTRSHVHPSNTSRDRYRRQRHAAAAIAAFLASWLGAGTADASFSGGLGCDRLAGSGANASTSLLAFASMEATQGDLTVAAIRYDDLRVGMGYGGSVNAGVRVHSTAGFRVVASRSRGDFGYAAWKLRLGPEVRLQSGVVISAYHMHVGDNVSVNANALGIELGKPLMPALWGQIGGSLVGRTGEPRRPQTTGALNWRLARHVQLLGEIDVGRTAVTTTSGSSGGSGPLPILTGFGSSGSTTRTITEDELEVVGLLGIRIVL